MDNDENIMKSAKRADFCPGLIAGTSRSHICYHCANLLIPVCIPQMCIITSSALSMFDIYHS